MGQWTRDAQIKMRMTRYLERLREYLHELRLWCCTDLAQDCREMQRYHAPERCRLLSAAVRRDQYHCAKYLPSYMYLVRTLNTRWFDGLTLLQVLAKGKNVMKRKLIYAVAEATRLKRRLDHCNCTW